MKRPQVKKIVHDRIIELQQELETRQARTGKTTIEIMQDDPFFAGRIYAMNMLTLDLIAALNDPDNEELIVLNGNGLIALEKTNKEE